MRQENRTPQRSAHKISRRKRRSPVFAPAILLCAVFSLLVIYFVANGSQGETPSITGYDNNSQAAAQSSQPSTPQTPAPALHAYDTVPEDSQPAPQILTFAELAEISNDHLLLVNINHAVPPYIAGNLVRISDYVRALNAETLLDEYVLAMLRVMFDSAADIGFTQFRVTQGFRTYEYQRMLFDTAPNRALVALPGHSEHQVGLAVDISYEGVNIGNSVQGTWLMENSYRYGFILRYPAHKTEITGVPFEPWHYRYVGQPHAYFMTGNDLVLEEYIDLLKTAGEITVVLDGTVYRVHYLAGPDEVIEIPENYAFWASLDNTGGIIVTTWAN